MDYFLRRLFGAALVIFGTFTLIFLILRWLPGDPAELVAGEDATAQTIAELRVQLGTDKPLWQQYTDYLTGLAHGDLGESYATREPVASRLAAQIPATLGLAGFSTLVAVSLGILLGVISATHEGSWVDTAIQSAMLAVASMPSFWLGMLLILIFSVYLQWLPAIGNGSLAQLVLPVACLGIATAGRLARMVRDSVLDVVQEPFVLALRGKGLAESVVLYRHVLRNALIPLITLLGSLVGEMLAGTVVVETLFARQGVGRLIYEAVGIKDIPLVQGAVLFVSLVYVVTNLVIDLSYRWIDRRIEF